MSKQITSLLLKKHVDSITDVKLKRKFLLDCLEKQGFIKKETDTELPEEIKNVCNVCGSNSIIIKDYMEICEICGTVLSESVNPYKTFKQNLNIGKLGTFISPEGVERQLSKVNTWVNTTPAEKKLQKEMMYIINVLDLIEGDYINNGIIFDKIKEDSVEMWFYIIRRVENLRGDKKKSFAALVIYYSMSYYGLKITLEKLSRQFSVNMGDISSQISSLRTIFYGTKWENYVNIKTKSKVNLELTPFLIKELENVKRAIKNDGMSPPGDNSIYGIIYAISKKESKRDPKYRVYNLKYLYDKTGVSSTTISTEAKKYEKYIK
tara:strand:- start:104 stop:1066 length:963 start_codon:yes stop_codon:yes gene_type:complete